MVKHSAVTLKLVGNNKYLARRGFTLFSSFLLRPNNDIIVSLCLCFYCPMQHSIDHYNMFII